MDNRSLCRGLVTDNCRAAADHYLLTIRLPLSFATPAPGQFVMVREWGRSEPFLARPLSVLGFERHGTHTVLELLYRVAGKGTSLLARLTPGSELSILGPLGRGFTRVDGIKRVLFVAGGVGVAPLLYLIHNELFSREMPDEAKGESDKIFYLGAKTEELLTGLDRLKGYCTVGICTDDGSRGFHGPVTGLLKRDIAGYDPKETIVYACGPSPMIRALGRLLADYPIPCQISFEERMACGLGACLGCAIAIRSPGGNRVFQRVCHDGPVFDLREVILEGVRIA